jgi:NAD(P)-dependent dehydrogenase (short-subunit alcohol dehydrogenase family)
VSADRELARRNALVTGAGYGIGREIALALGAAGAHVVLAARSIDALEATASGIKAAGGHATVIPTDVGDPDQVSGLAERVHAELGALDILVSNSGIAGPTAELWRIEPEEWEATFRVNVTGTYLVCRAFLPAMIERHEGSIVAIGSATGKRPMAGRTPYAASKLALVGLVRTLAWEVGPHGLRVNLISPGPTEGERIQKVMERQAAAAGTSLEEARPKLTSGSPLRRFTLASEVADAVLFLASDRARAITGQDLNVSSGWVMH